MNTQTKLWYWKRKLSNAEDASAVARDKFYDRINMYRHENQPSERSAKRWQDGWEWKKHLLQDIQHTIFELESNGKQVSG